MKIENNYDDCDFRKEEAILFLELAWKSCTFADMDVLNNCGLNSCGWCRETKGIWIDLE